MKRIIFIFTLLFGFAHAEAKDQKEVTGDAARKMFEKVYDLVFGKEGSAFSYSVNIIELYKTEGNIMYKGKKIMYREKRYMAWEDGVTAYMVDRKKREVNIYRYDDDRKDELLNKFKYDVNNYTFSYKPEGSYYLVTAKLKNPSFFGIKSVTARVMQSNLYPVDLIIKVSFFSTTVKIKNFRHGNIDDKNFVFPKDAFVDYKFNNFLK